MNFEMGLILTGVIVVAGAAGMAGFLIWVRTHHEEKKGHDRGHGVKHA